MTSKKSWISRGLVIFQRGPGFYLSSTGTTPCSYADNTLGDGGVTNNARAPENTPCTSTAVGSSENLVRELSVVVPDIAREREYNDIGHDDAIIQINGIAVRTVLSTVVDGTRRPDG